jgi:hypothetical protein
MRGLRDTRKIKAWLRAGKSVEIRDRDHLVGRIIPESEPGEPKDIEWPDFEARRKKIFGDRKLNAVEEFLKDRHRD